MANYFALVPAAGRGDRMGGSVPKQYLTLNGKPILHHTLRRLCEQAQIAKVWVILSPEDALWDSFAWQDLQTRLQVVRCGGETRAQSVKNGLSAMKDFVQPADWVLVHDAARPFVSHADVGKLLALSQTSGICGGLIAEKMVDTLKRDDGQGKVSVTMDRRGLWLAQTPQMFPYGLLVEALQTHPHVTDESSAVEALGYSPQLVQGDGSGFKITTQADLRFAQAWLQQEKLS